jgi:hypothetical protein
MPLVHSASKKAIGENIAIESAAGKKHSQAVAIALDVARRARDNGGPLPSIPAPRAVQQVQQLQGLSGEAKIHTGPIHSIVAGRTDHLPVHVPSNSYVIPADIVSAFGEGNTNAGFKVLRRVFSGLPYGRSSAQPYGHRNGPYGGGSAPYNQAGGPYGAQIPGRAAGGSTGNDVKETHTVPVIVAGGEFTLTPEEVLKAGDGDMERGHRVLDDFVLQSRKKLIHTLKKLPGPKHD